MRANKLRTALTGFAVAWGILMVIVLLAVGNGFSKGISDNFNYMKTNTLSIYPNWTSMAYKGMPARRRISFNPQDVEKIRHGLTTIANVTAFTPIYNQWSSTISYGNSYTSGTINGVEQDYFVLRYLTMEKGRFLNASDLENCAKVIVIHESTADLLFGDEDPLGKYITAAGLLFKVIGVYSQKASTQNPSLFAPFTTTQLVFNKSKSIGDISFMVDGADDEASIEKLKADVRRLIAGIKVFDPADEQAMWIDDRRESMKSFSVMFSLLETFLWGVGLASLLAGVVGVSNIMIVTVSERTREFGIRKALGAPPSSILLSVLSESLAITVIFGFVGMFLGIVLTEALSYYLAANPPEGALSIMKDPSVDLSTALSALAVLVVSGIFAGYMPARKAVKIKPIEAMNAK